jgi:hypothetical protein
VTIAPDRRRLRWVRGGHSVSLGTGFRCDPRRRSSLRSRPAASTGPSAALGWDIWVLCFHEPIDLHWGSPCCEGAEGLPARLAAGLCCAIVLPAERGGNGCFPLLCLTARSACEAPLVLRSSPPTRRGKASAVARSSWRRSGAKSLSDRHRKPRHPNHGGEVSRAWSGCSSSRTDLIRAEPVSTGLASRLRSS